MHYHRSLTILTHTSVTLFRALSYIRVLICTLFLYKKGHFGPINVIGINPNGRSYASGGEDGYIRLHHFDQDYLEKTDPVPEEEIKLAGEN